MKRFKPDVVLGMGGYVSGPGGLAAWSLGIPVVLHEQNGIAGLTNKCWRKSLPKLCRRFPVRSRKRTWWVTRCVWTCCALPLPDARLTGREGPVRVLSSAALRGAVLNQTMPQVAAKLGDTVTIWHQSGKGAQQTVEQAYADEGQPQHKVTEFIDDMAAAYAWADVVVCRSGRADGERDRPPPVSGRCLCRSSTKTDSSTGMRCRLRKPVPRRFLSSHNIPPTRSPPPWRAGTETHCWRWRHAHARTAIPDATERVAKEVSLAAQA